MRASGKLCVTSAILVLSASAAFAGECARFGGVYLGINAGWAAQDATWDFQFGSSVTSASAPRTGGTVGAQIGYNLQAGCTLVGVELDANWPGLGGSKRYGPASVEDGPSFTLDDDVKWFGTARLRGGVVVRKTCCST